MDVEEQLPHVEHQLQQGDLQLSIHDPDGHDGSDEFRHGLNAQNRKLSKNATSVISAIARCLTCLKAPTRAEPKEAFHGDRSRTT